MHQILPGPSCSPLLLSPQLDGVKEICCATFVVSRERILAHPKEFYKHLFTWLVDTVCTTCDCLCADASVCLCALGVNGYVAGLVVLRGGECV